MTSKGIARFFTVLLSETYECSVKFVEICQWQLTSAKMYFKTQSIKAELKKKMKYAVSYQEWKSYADRYDHLRDVRIWKETHQTSLYDWEYIKNLTQALKEAKEKHDIKKIMLLIRSNCVRNLANILNPALYTKSYVGTKSLIEEFQREVIFSIEF